MYDRSVWIEEVDKGLYDLIKKVVHYPDSIWTDMTLIIL